MITLTTSGSNSTVTLSYTAQTAKVIDTLSAAAEYWYKSADNGTPFASLTNAQKLAVIDAYILRVVLDAAKTQYIIAAQEAAGLAAQTEAETKFI